MKDREQILEMLTKVKDQFSLSIYKKVYHISDAEIAKKEKCQTKILKNNKRRD